MHMAERLYLDGYLTYPRTETNTYPKNFDLQSAVRAQSGHPVWGSYSNDLLSWGLARPREGRGGSFLGMVLGEQPQAFVTMCSSAFDISFFFSGSSLFHPKPTTQHKLAPRCGYGRPSTHHAGAGGDRGATGRCLSAL